MEFGRLVFFQMQEEKDLKFQVLGNALRALEFPSNKFFKNKAENNLYYLMDKRHLFLLCIYCTLVFILMMMTYHDGFQKITWKVYVYSGQEREDGSESET